MNEQTELVRALRPVVDALNLLEIEYYIGGSVASSFYGAMRTTMDVDLVANIHLGHVSGFLTNVRDEYYASEQAIQDAIRRSSCFNLIHLPTSFKVDIFVHRGRPFDESALRRAATVILGGVNGLQVQIATPEDVIISKLEWYRLGNESSERQWNDVSTVLKLLGDVADATYLRQSAAQVGVADLLERLIG